MVKIALVGAGEIAKWHAEAIRAIKGARIVAVVDMIKEKAEHLANFCQATAYEIIEESLPGVDLVYILTPPSFHKELAVKAIEARKHVVVEKPLAVSLQDAEAIVEAAKKAKVKLMTAFNMRFRDGFLRLKETVESRKLGGLVSFWSQRLGEADIPEPNWRTTKGLICGMTIESLSHDIDLIRWIAGEIAWVMARVFESRSDLSGFDDNASVIFSLASGGTAIIHASWTSHLGRNSRGVIGSRGSAMVAGSGLWNLDRFHLKTAKMKHEVIEILDDKFDRRSYWKENWHFIDCVKRNRRPMVTGEDGLAALRISHAILASHRENKPVFL